MLGHSRQGGGGSEDRRDDKVDVVAVVQKEQPANEQNNLYTPSKGGYFFPLRQLLTLHPVLMGMLVRWGVAWALPILMDGPHAVIPGVSYTDVDYSVYTDAAHLLQQGHSPYDRHTYRYTPFLAVLLAHLHSIFGPNGGRYLFCAVDTLCGYMVLKFRQCQRTNANDSTNSDPSTTPQDALWWLYNPLAINICTRGSAEPLVALLPVLCTLWIVTKGGGSATTYNPSGSGMDGRIGGRTRHSCRRAVVAGLVHGVAVHAKLYPVIHTLSYAAYLAGPLPPPSPSLPTPKGKKDPHTSSPSSSSGMAGTTAHMLLRWVRHLLQSPPALLFGVSSVLSFSALTLVAVACYGTRAWEEGFAYHLSRLDHRHNYSSHWYWIYLFQGKVAAQGGPSAIARFVGPALLLPQAVLLLYTSLGLAPHNPPLALFVQTYIFVALNKVITAQYFVWHLSLLPLCADQLVWNTNYVRLSLLAIVGSTGLWLFAAYTLELQNRPSHRIVWMASLAFFAAHVTLLDALTIGTMQGDRASRGGKEEEVEKAATKIAASPGAAAVPVRPSSSAPRWKPHVE